MQSVPILAQTALAAAVLLLATGCSVTVPEGKAPAVGALVVTGPHEAPELAELPTTAPAPAAPAPSSSAAQGPAASAAPAGPAAGRALNQAEELLPKVNVKPWRATLPVVVQSVGKDMQCSIGSDAAACHLINDVAPRPADVKGQCRGLSEYFGGYAVVTLDGGHDVRPLAHRARVHDQHHGLRTLVRRVS